LDIDTQAKAYGTGLSVGAIELTEVIQWADELISGSDKPSMPLIDLSLTNSLATAISILNSLAVKPDPQVAAKLLIRHLFKGVTVARISYEHASATLFQMALAGEFPDKESEASMWAFSDELDLANRGTYGEPQTVKQQILAFLASHAA
jgi:hypothetical protein